MGLDLTFLHAARIPRCTSRVDKFFEGYQSLQFIRRGAVELFYDETQHVVEAPAFWTCYPGPHIRFHGHQGRSWHHCYAAMRGPGLLDWQQRGLFFRGVQLCPARHAAHCGRLMDEIIRLIHTPGPLSSQRASNLLEFILLDLAEWRQARSQSEPWLAVVLAAIESTPGGHSDYPALARKCGMALSTLRRRFHRKTGLSLHRYVLEWRITKACRLVGSTDLPFKEIAERLGYDNVFYFSRQFREFQGVPPLVYRRSRQS
jgi:AraC-like DNA-binding protein